MTGGDVRCAVVDWGDQFNVSDSLGPNFVSLRALRGGYFVARRAVWVEPPALGRIRANPRESVSKIFSVASGAPWCKGRMVADGGSVGYRSGGGRGGRPVDGEDR